MKRRYVAELPENAAARFQVVYQCEFAQRSAVAESPKRKMLAGAG